MVIIQALQEQHFSIYWGKIKNTIRHSMGSIA